ncbi:TniQ family protein, partial [Aquicoccus sp. SU-CL01552]|uniref:TniQ family protein n=1 Tax=Aquicoccus sp. SU-CL01552 TaxID=3127656 RepID=UPI00333F9934
MMLAPHIPFDAEESPLSFAARLAQLHTGDRLVSFLRDFGIKPEQMAVNDETALTRLAEVSGVAVEVLRANAAVRVGKRTYDLRGELVTAEFLANPYTVFCPACLAEDDRTGLRRGRWEWALSVVRTCPHHEIPLLRQAQGAWDDKLHELDRRVPERGERLDALVSQATRRSVSPLQGYVMRRLDGKAGPEWLDAQTLDQATRATELLGVLVAFGAAQRLPELTSDDWDHASRVGYEFTSRGESGIREAFEAQFRKYDDATGTPGARKIFGSFYNAMAHSKSLKDPGDIVRILRETIVANIALPAGSEVLGADLTERKLHTVASLAKEQDLDSRTLRGVLVAAGIVPDNAPAHFAFPAEQGRGVAKRVKRVVHVNSVPDALNCARPLVDFLFADRVLTPIYYGRPGVRGRTQKAVDREDLAGLVGRLHAKAVEVDGADDALVPISKAAEKARVQAISVVHMILGGFLERVVRVAAQKGVGALRVDPEEI